ncbi:MAG: hypothetical protein KDB68_04925 [Planctomycetes bacterium]|nr:hypothetical protein [Planctomycetota bacterium]MCA8935527.1 hypothetical protein [Planctomycetota bacterium]MCA8945058.1 hypothetical protein [Planctomycetota bacterium]
MGCLYLLVALISPRLLLALMWIFSPYVQPNAFKLWVWPLLGLIFMPWMTLALVWGYNTHFGLFQIAAVVIGAMIDLGSSGDAERRRRRQSKN